MAGLALVAFLSFSTLITGVAAISRTETIDDAEVGPYPTTSSRLATIGFYPPNNGYWGTQLGSTDTMVVKTLTTAKLYDGTFTAASSFAPSTPRSITIDFFGTSIKAFFTISNSWPTHCDITLDEGRLIEMRHEPGNLTEDVAYQVPGVEYKDLSPGLHRMQIQVVPFSEKGTVRNFVSFDYAEYTFDSTAAEAYQQQKSSNRSGSSAGVEPESEKDSGNQTAAIVGGTIGGAAALAAIVLVIYFRSRRSRAMSSSDSSSIEKVGMHPSGSQSRRGSAFPRWRAFGSFMVRSPDGSGPTPDPSTMPSVSSHQHPGGPEAHRHSMVSSMSASTKAHPLYLHIGPDGNSQWLSSPSEVHRLHLNSVQGSPQRRNSDDRLDSLGLHLNTIHTPKTPYQSVSPGGGSIAAAARELHTPYQYAIPEPSPNSSGYR
ncbi:hypothetical protein BKA70DRAFT_1303130 [Coprinopsis sp. MPI-PUGE-AT-0042]|nr:hypothetical protein BKA70DRAFT_1303130 [Coprinopsis sp. MPI-PUGE-AT-0042]